MDILTAKDMAQIIGRAAVTIRRHAREKDIGTKTSAGWIFTRGDVEKFRSIPPAGRPKERKES